MEIYKSEFWTISFDNETKIICPTWYPESVSLTDVLYREEMLNYTDIVEQYKPQKALIDNTLFGFPITPELQEWTNNELFPRILAVGVKRVALIMPQELLTQFGLEQVMEEAHGLEFETRYFSDLENGKEWLIS